MNTCSRRFAAKMKTELERRQRMEGRMEERRRRVRDQCTPPTWKQNVTERELLKRKKPEVVVSISNRFLHCPITKAASTFWFRLVQTYSLASPLLLCCCCSCSCSCCCYCCCCCCCYCCCCCCCCCRAATSVVVVVVVELLLLLLLLLL